MPKASPMVRSFNAGEFSPLLEGRVDLDRYPASLQSLKNYIAAPQGPAISRSGTQFLSPVVDRNEFSALIPFVFSNEQAVVLEFGPNVIRFFDEDSFYSSELGNVGIVTLGGQPILSSENNVDLNLVVGDQVFLDNFVDYPQLNNQSATVAFVGGAFNEDGSVSHQYNLQTNFDFDIPLFTRLKGTASKTYRVTHNYTEAQRKTLRYVQSVDVMYLLCPTAKPKKLSRYGKFDWRLEDLDLKDGPYLPTNDTPTTLTPATTGNALPDMTSDTNPSGQCSGSGNRPAINGSRNSPAEFLGRGISYRLPASAFYYAFDNDDNTYWAGNAQQKGVIQYAPATPFVCDGYTIYAAKDNQDTSYTAKDYAPSSFTFEGRNGTVWTILDEQQDYVLYDGNKSVFFEIDNKIAYEEYKLSVTKLTRNGLIEPRVRRLGMRAKDDASVEVVLAANSTEGINNDTGFQATDTGRLIRLKGSDGAWRSCEIVGVVDSQQVRVKLLGEPLINIKPITQWRLGYWSDTTGWPATGDFFEDRLWLAGSQEYPDMFAGSVTGAYETFSQTDTFGVVLDDSAVVGELNSRKLSRIRWLSSDARGLLLSTGSEEYTLSSPSNEAVTARNLKARLATRRGSANVEPVRTDNQVLYVQRGGRAIRELAFVFEADGYRSPSMSQLAGHIGAKPFVEMEYAAEPYSIVWIMRNDGSLVGLTYNRDEDVIGWHQHDLAGGEIETLTVIPQKDQLQDALWVTIKRSINGQHQKYIERLTPFWDFNTGLDDAHFVDSAIRYTGAATAEISGLSHLEGEQVYGLADGRPVGPLTVNQGKVTLLFDAQNVVLGLGYESEAVLPRLENGAADGTAQGKVKRINSIVVSLWNSAGGEVGVYNEQEESFVYEPLRYPRRGNFIDDLELYTGKIGPIHPTPGYDMDGRIAFRRPADNPLPFNVVAIMPQLNTQDR